LKKQKRLKAQSEVMYTSVEAAELLGVTPRTIQIWADSGVLQARKTSGGHRRFSESVLEAFLKKLETDSQGAQPEAAKAPAKSRHYQILIAEDEPDLRTLYEMTMEGWELPMEVTAVKDGYEALIRLGVDRPDMLIADLSMPKMDGFYMLNTIVNSGSATDTDIVVVTALTAADIEARGGLPDGITVFHKPIPFEKLQQLIKDKISKRSS
jgi:excisionase family DNA binding protein